jgi:TIR domain
MFDVFFSHSSKDKEFVRRLRADLENYGYSSWIDEDHLRVGDALAPELKEAMRNSRFVAAVYSANSANSPWFATEQCTAAAAGIPIIPILLDQGSLTHALAQRVYADFTHPSDQHAYHRAFHEILRMLGMAGNPPAELWIYSNGLCRGWLNSSWDAKCIERYNIDGVRKCCFRAELGPFGGIAFVFRSGINTAPYSSLRFSLNGGKVAGQKIKLYVNDRIGNGIRNQVSVDELTPNEWRPFNVTLQDLDAQDSIIFKINWSDRHGATNDAVMLADVRFCREENLISCTRADMER